MYSGVASGRAFCSLIHFLGLPHNWQYGIHQISNCLLLGFLIYPWESEFLHSAIITIASSQHLWSHLTKQESYQPSPLAHEPKGEEGSTGPSIEENQSRTLYQHCWQSMWGFLWEHKLQQWLKELRIQQYAQIQCFFTHLCSQAPYCSVNGSKVKAKVKDGFRSEYSKWQAKLC